MNRKISNWVLNPDTSFTYTFTEVECGKGFMVLSAQKIRDVISGLLGSHADRNIAVNIAYGTTPQDWGLTTGNCDDSSQNHNMPIP
jgi:hypothetical protein